MVFLAVPELLSAAPIPALRQSFAAGGQALYLVGGPVRDALLGRGVADLDFATDATPPTIKQLLRTAGARGVYAIGEKFGTIGAIFDSVTVEITTYRSESYTTGSRKPAVEFGTSLHGDLARRDLTINAMALDLSTGEVIDPFHGEADLAARLIRAVGIPSERFLEDPLRLMRAVRFSAQLAFEMDPSTAEAIKTVAPSLATISRERIAQEMNRILTSDQPAYGIRLLCDLGLMEHVVPEIPLMRGTRNDSLQHKDVFEHTLVVTSRVPAVLHLRWAALLHDIAKPRTLTIDRGQVHFYGHDRIGEKMSRRILGPSGLKYDRDTVDQVSQLVGLHLRPNGYESDWTDGAVRRFMREAGPLLPDVLTLSRADVTSRRRERVEAAQRRVTELEGRCAEISAEAEVAKLSSPLDGLELMTMFDRTPGPWIREIKDHLLELVLDGDLGMDDKARAAEIARKLMAQS
ncbi:MAG: HD domain-containing protein [Chloroflexota bacterium]